MILVSCDLGTAEKAPQYVFPATVTFPTFVYPASVTLTIVPSGWTYRYAYKSFAVTVPVIITVSTDNHHTAFFILYNLLSFLRQHLSLYCDSPEYARSISPFSYSEYSLRPINPRPFPTTSGNRQQLAPPQISRHFATTKKAARLMIRLLFSMLSHLYANYTNSRPTAYESSVVPFLVLTVPTVHRAVYFPIPVGQYVFPVAVLYAIKQF